MGDRRARRPSGQRDPAGRPVLDQARADSRRRRNDPRHEPPQAGRRADALLPPLPPGRPVRQRRRLLDAVAGAGRAGGLGERLPDGLEHESEDRHRPDARQAPRRDDQGQHALAHAAALGAAHGDGGAQRAMRSRRRHRHPHRGGARHGDAADLRSEPGRVELRSHHHESEIVAVHADLAARQPRDRRALRPRFELQGRDRDGRARLRPLHARLALRRPRLLHRVRQAGPGTSAT